MVTVSRNITWAAPESAVAVVLPIHNELLLGFTVSRNTQDHVFVAFVVSVSTRLHGNLANSARSIRIEDAIFAIYIESLLSDIPVTASYQAAQVLVL